MSKKISKPYVFFSDLHIDRWDRLKKERFFEFIERVEETAAGVYILGDIFDFPALKGDSIWPRHKDTVNRILGLSRAGLPVNYLIGNHDISLRGIEIEEVNFRLTYPDNKHPFEVELFGKKVYMEHGHYYDPLFQEHIYDAVDFLRAVTGKAVDQSATDFLRDVVRIFQRKPKHDADKAAAKEKTEVGVPERFLKLWEEAAEQLLKKRRCDIAMFGHTHGPALSRMLGGPQFYVNTGDWVAHSTYVEMTENSISLMDWIEGSTIRQEKLD